MTSDDNAFWSGSGSFNDPFIERPQGIMQTADRRKRQNCGHLLYGCPWTVLGCTGQAELGSNLTVAAEGNASHYYGPMFSAQDSNEGSTTKSLVANSRYSFQPQTSDESRNPYKRKSLMDGSAGGVASRNLSGQRENDFGRFTPVSGTRRLESSMNHAYGDPHLTWESCNSFQSSRTRARANRYDGPNVFQTPGNYRSPSILGGVPSQELMPRRTPTASHGLAGNMGVGPPEVLSFGQGNSFSGFGTWCSNNTFGEEGNNLSGFVHGGTHSRNSPREVVGRSQTDSRLPQPSIRTSRPVHPREFNFQASFTSHHNLSAYGRPANIQPPGFLVSQPEFGYNNVHTSEGGMQRLSPPGSAASRTSLMSTPEALYGDVHPSFTITPGQAPLSTYNDINRASYVQQMPLHGQRAAPSQEINRHRFATSHELFNQSFIYNGGDWADAQDQHRDMRLDVDSMSYEELLALEERIGNVNTGLSEDMVDKCLKTSMFSCCDTATASGGKSEESDLKCSICQEEYLEGDELGQLDCGHGYHTACIKQWLVLKDLCPICKAGVSFKA